MNISYFRSSSYHCFNLCQHQYFLNYVLGIPNIVGIKAHKGTIAHKVLEILAKAKLASQNDQSIITDDIFSNNNIPIDQFKTDSFIEYAYNHAFSYYNEKDQLCLSDADFREVKRWIYKVINEGTFDPRNFTIISPERYFNLEIKKDWARLPNNKYLTIKGTIDLIVEHDNSYEIIDWKTGKCMSYISMKPKTYVDLVDDFQLRLYHYAMRKLYPHQKNVLVTIHYINDGGPRTITHDDSNLSIVEARLYNQFVNIRDCVRPIRRDNAQGIFCNRICSYGKHFIDNKTQCQYIYDQLRLEGMTSTIANHTFAGFNINDYEEPG